MKAEDQLASEHPFLLVVGYCGQNGACQSIIEIHRESLAKGLSLNMTTDLL